MNLFDEALKRISEIIKFDSSQKPAIVGAPFGRGVDDCLKYFLNLASSYGFETKNHDGYAGEVIFGEGEEFAVLAHLDVVPAGSGWTHDPFGGEIDTVNKKIWGRGAMDDKGPAILTLLVMKALKDEGFVSKKKIKLIVGCNEESGWACIDYYKAHAHMPDTGFSPDADFPVIYAEKGILQLELKFAPCGDFTALRGGERANMVCDLCEVTAPEDKAKLVKFGLEYADGKVISRGKSAHGSTPEAGVNAIAPVLKYLGLDGMHRLLFEDGFNLCNLEDETGKLTFSPNIIKQSKDGISVICDIRYPATLKREVVLNAISDKGVNYEIAHEQAPLFSDKKSGLITTLLQVYNEVTGKHAKPVAIGGGTYARALKCGVAFGPEEEGEENTVHQANEYITFEKIEKCLKIYKLALQRLC